MNRRGPAPNPALLQLFDAPADLRARSAELLGVVCPAGTQLFERVEERKGWLSLHRHCETPAGVYEGPTVHFSTDGKTSSLTRKGEHRGLRHGTWISFSSQGTVYEHTYNAGKPVGRYHVRLTSGRTLIDGTFDRNGQLDGEWVFSERSTGNVLSRSTMKHGTGRFTSFANPTSTVQVLAVDCVDGLYDGAVELRQQRSYGGHGADDLQVNATFRRGLPDGPWKRTRVSGIVLEDGTYARGAWTGTWKMIAPQVCQHRELMGDVVDCVSEVKDVPYTCRRGGSPTCNFDKAGMVVDPDDARPREPETFTRPMRCELPSSYFIGN